MPLPNWLKAIGTFLSEVFKAAAESQLASEHDPIEHVVVLMLENHSFDQMLGCFKQVYPRMEGIDPSNPRVNRDNEGHVYKQGPTSVTRSRLDPKHEYEHVINQLADGNAGFVRDLQDSYDQANPDDFQYVMTDWSQSLRGPVYLSYRANDGTVVPHPRLTYLAEGACTHYLANAIGDPRFAKL